MDSIFLEALSGKVPERTPVWIMRQAGRYLPEYRALREQAGSFLALCQTPEWACEATLQPLRRFDLDAAIIFSDILTVPDAMGLGLSFAEGEGPRFARTVQSMEEAMALSVPKVRSSLAYVADAVALTRSRMPAHIPLIGFCGSPFTLACYMIEGRGSKSFVEVKRMLYAEPEAMHQLLHTLTATLIEYLSMQIDAGADAVQIFDTWGGILSTPSFEAFDLYYTRQILDALANRAGRRVPVICFTKDAPIAWYRQYAEAGASAVGVDWRHSLREVRRQVGDKLPLQGNMDPYALIGKPESMVQRAREIVQEMRGTPHIFNLGHGIDKSTPPEHLQLLVETVHSTYR